MQENYIIAYIFERKLVEETDDFVSFALVPIEAVCGKEMMFEDLNGLKVLTADSDTLGESKAFNFLGEENISNDKFVYAFPLPLDESKLEASGNILETFQNEIKNLSGKVLCEIFNKEDGISKVYYYDKENNSTISVDQSDPYALYNILYGDMESVRKTAELIDKNKEVFLAPSVEVERISTPPKALFANEIFEELSKTIKCQDEAIMRISSSVAKNSRIDNPRFKSNMFIYGPEGVGKTEIFKTLSSKFDIPVTIEDTNEYMNTVIEGGDTSYIFLNLLQSAGYDFEKAQNGIIVFDNIENCFKRTEEFDTMVLPTITKIIDGTTYTVACGEDVSDFDTKNITFAFIGKSNNNKVQIGFSNESGFDPYRHFGFNDSFMHRIDNVIQMNDLTIQDLKKILKESDISALKYYKKFFEQENIRFRYDDKTITAIAKKAYQSGISAKSLKIIVDDALLYAFYHALSNKEYSNLTIRPQPIENNKKYVLK